jgi:ABC-type transport system involved in Fe-S cluster assembly fused permease/ATPase subunit
VNQSLVDTERLLKLLNEPKDVEDKPDASDLLVGDGEIEFGWHHSLLSRNATILIIYEQITSVSLTTTEPLL